MKYRLQIKTLAGGSSRMRPADDVTDISRGHNGSQFARTRTSLNHFATDDSRALSLAYRQVLRGPKSPAGRRRVLFPNCPGFGRGWSANRAMPPIARTFPRRLRGQFASSRLAGGVLNVFLKLQLQRLFCFSFERMPFDPPARASKLRCQVIALATPKIVNLCSLF